MKYVGWGAIASPVVGLGTAIGLGPSLLERQRAAARREGIPLLPEDLHRTLPVADADNAALPLQALIEAWKRIPKAEVDYWDHAASDFNKNPTDTLALAAFVEKLSQYPTVLALAEEASRRPHCDFHYDWKQGPNLAFNEFASTRRAGRFMIARARIAASAEEALADISCVARLGQLIWETPTVIAANVGLTLQSMAHSAFLEALQRFGPGSFVRETLQAFGPAPDPLFYSRGDVVCSLVTMKLLREGKMRPEPEDEWPGCNSGAYWNSLTDIAFLTRDYWEERLIFYWRRSFAILRSTPDQNEREKRLENLADQLDRGDYLQQSLNLITRILGPVYTSGLVETPRKLELLRAFRETAVILLEAKAATGSFPAQPALPHDPYGHNKPLGYRREGEGCILWSVGPNRKDDGGVALSSDKRILDLVVRL